MSAHRATGQPRVRLGDGVELMGEVVRVREVAWTLPQPLYDALQQLQEGVMLNNALRWQSVEDAATHLLIVAVREAFKEVKVHQTRERMVLLPNELPKPK